jgi:hypothetical protein
MTADVLQDSIATDPVIAFDEYPHVCGLRCWRPRSVTPMSTFSGVEDISEACGAVGLSNRALCGKWSMGSPKRGEGTTIIAAQRRGTLASSPPACSEPRELVQDRSPLWANGALFGRAIVNCLIHQSKPHFVLGQAGI